MSRARKVVSIVCLACWVQVPAWQDSASISDSSTPSSCSKLQAEQKNCIPRFCTRKPCDLAASAILFGSRWLCHKFQINQNHPLLPSGRKSYVPQSITEAHVLAGVVALGAIPFALETREGFHHFRGYALSSSTCYFLYGLTSSVVGRLRPNYDAALALGEKVEKKSFFSGHTTMSFASATYMSNYLYRRLQCRPLSLLAGIGLYSLASYVAYTRYTTTCRTSQWALL